MTPTGKAAFEAQRAELDAPRIEERIPCCDVCRGHHGMRGVRFIANAVVLFACERCVRRMTSELWGGGMAGGSIAPIDYNPLVERVKR